MKEAMRKTTTTGSLAEDGWERIVFSDALKRDVEALFFDVCNYLLVLVKNDARFDETAQRLLRKAVTDRDAVAAERHLQTITLELNAKDRKLLGKLYDLGTRPMRLMSGMRLFFNPQIQQIVEQFFGQPEAPSILVRPFNGETLHVFPPGEENYRYNLPVHQDFPYLLQSEKQLTFWLNLTDNLNGEAGGVRIYPRTHKLGLPKTTKNTFGHYEVAVEHYPEFDQNDYVESASGMFELYAIDSLTWHSSVPSISKDSTRLTYIFRVSDIGAPDRIPYGADRSHPQGKRFENLYPELYIEPATQ